MRPRRAVGPEARGRADPTEAVVSEYHLLTEFV